MKYNSWYAFSPEQDKEFHSVKVGEHYFDLSEFDYTDGGDHNEEILFIKWAHPLMHYLENKFYGNNVDYFTRYGTVAEILAIIKPDLELIRNKIVPTGIIDNEMDKMEDYLTDNELENTLGYFNTFITKLEEQPVNYIIYCSSD